MSDTLNTEIDTTTQFNLDVVVKKLEEATGIKAIKDNIFAVEYMIGKVDENILNEIGFKFLSMSNVAGNDTPIYRLGDIEALFVGNILHIYKATV